MKTMRNLSFLALALFAGVHQAAAQGTAFTFQGHLMDGGNPANGLYDFRSGPVATNTGGAIVAGPVTNAAVMVSNGLFVLTLDYGPVFDGTPYWLQMGVRTNGGGAFIGMSPRPEVTPTPYSIFAGTASNLSGTLPASQLSGIIPSADMSGAYGNALNLNNAANTFTGSFSGNGASVTSLNANNLASGTVPDARLSGNVVLRAGGNALTGNQTITSGKLGIGTTSPKTALQVNGTNGTSIRVVGPAGGGSTVAYDLSTYDPGTNPPSAQILATDDGNFGNNLDLLTRVPGNLNNALVSRMHIDSTTGIITGNGGGLTNLNANAFNGLAALWQTGGNNVSAGQFLGSTNNQPVELWAGGQRALRLEPDPSDSGSPNVIGGSPGNSAASGVSGATIFGGAGFSSANSASTAWTTISGGIANQGNGIGATVGGGGYNSANGQFAIVPGGSENTASGDYSFAAGNRAQALYQGDFVWADSQNYNFSSTAVNQFCVRSTGGARFVTAIDGSGNATAGVKLNSGDTAWSTLSDRNAKKNFKPVDGEAVLEMLAAIPVEKWNYKWEADTSTPHLGPMAQDFKAAFYPGRDDKSITTLEFDGVELAAIQGLNKKLQEKDAEIQQLKEKADKVDSLEKRLGELEKIVKTISEKR
jgi:hypothetical protein